VTSNPDSGNGQAALHARARRKGVNPLVYWLLRAILQPLFHLYFRLSRIGREHVPESGGVIFCANHRSFLDPFVIATIARRPMYYVAKQELFRYRLIGWLLSALGAFPVDRGGADQDMLATAKTILARGDALLVFAEGTRIRPGTLGRPKRGVGRLALESGAPVVPVAVIGTEAVRKGWRIRPHKVRIRIGSPLTFLQVENASPQLAAAVTDRIWPNVMLQWEWLGGLAPLRRAAVIGAGSWGTAVAVMLARAGLEVDLGTRTPEQADAVAAARRDERHLPGVELPRPVKLMRATELELSRHDLVCFAVPAGALPAAVAAHASQIPSRAGVLVLSKGMVAPLGTLPSAFVAERTESWAVGVLGGPAHPAAALDGGASLVFAAADPAFRRQVTEALTAAGFDAAATPDVVGVELAGCAARAAALAVATASHAGANAAGSAAGKVFAEVDAYARAAGAQPGTLVGLAGTGELVAGVLAGDERAEAPACVPLLADRARQAGVEAPVLRGLANVIEGKITTDRWIASLTAPRPAAKREKVRAA
jgi:glycerol-3-phosphate dehydrogenase (NAD(P)+)